MIWLILIAATAAVIAWCLYQAGKVAGLGRGEIERDGLAEQLAGADADLLAAREQIQAQHNRIVRMTQWELLPWPDGRTSPPSVRPVPQPRQEEETWASQVSRSAGPSGAAETAWPPPGHAGPGARSKPPRSKRTSTAAFLDPPPRAAELEAEMKPPPERGDWWGPVEDEIWAAKLWLAGL